MAKVSDNVKALRRDPRYREALAKARTPEERKAVAGMVEGLFDGLMKAVEALAQRAQDDPGFERELRQALDEGTVGVKPPT